MKHNKMVNIGKLKIEFVILLTVIFILIYIGTIIGDISQNENVSFDDPIKVMKEYYGEYYLLKSQRSDIRALTTASEKFNDAWKSASNIQKTEVVNLYSNEIDKLWDIVTKKNDMFDLMTKEQLTSLWGKGSQDMTEKRAEMLRELDHTRQEKLLKSLYETSIKGLDKTNTNKISYNFEGINKETIEVVTNDNKKLMFSLKNLPAGLKEQRIDTVTFNGNKESMVRVIFEKEKKINELFLKEGEYIAMSKPDNENGFDVIHSQKGYLFTGYLDDSSGAKFLSENGKYHIWSKGHINIDGGVEIRKIVNDNIVYRVFPNPFGAIERKTGLGYAFIQDVGDGKEAYQITGNYVNQEKRFGAFIRNGVIDHGGSFTDPNYNGRILKVTSQEEGLNIDASNARETKFVFKVGKKAGDEVDFNRNDFTHIDGRGWVPRHSAISEHINENGQGVGKGEGYRNSHMNSHAQKTRDNLKESHRSGNYNFNRGVIFGWGCPGGSCGVRSWSF